MCRSCQPCVCWSRPTTADGRQYYCSLASARLHIAPSLADPADGQAGGRAGSELWAARPLLQRMRSEQAPKHTMMGTAPQRTVSRRVSPAASGGLLGLRCGTMPTTGHHAAPRPRSHRRLSRYPNDPLPPLAPPSARRHAAGTPTSARRRRCAAALDAVQRRSAGAPSPSQGPARPAKRPRRAYLYRSRSVSSPRGGVVPFCAAVGMKGRSLR